MCASLTDPSLSVNEAACVTGVPPKQVHRIIDSGLLDEAVQGGSRVRRAVCCDGLVGLKLAHETTNILTLDARRRLVRYLLDHPEAMTVCERHVSVDVRPMKSDVRRVSPCLQERMRWFRAMKPFFPELRA